MGEVRRLLRRGTEVRQEGITKTHQGHPTIKLKMQTYSQAISYTQRVWLVAWQLTRESKVWTADALAKAEYIPDLGMAYLLTSLEACHTHDIRVHKCCDGFSRRRPKAPLVKRQVVCSYDRI